MWPYGPGQPYLLAAAAELFDRSLLWWRIVRVACDAGVALLVFSMLRGRVPLWLALTGWLCAACAMAQPVSANPFPAALLAGLGAFAVVTARSPARRAWLWGGAAGAASRRRGGWTSGCTRRARPASRSCCVPAPPAAKRAGEALRFAGTAGAAGLLLYAPFVVAVGPAEMYDQLVATAGRERDYWTLPFPVGYDGPSALAAGRGGRAGQGRPGLLRAAARDDRARPSPRWRRSATGRHGWWAPVALAAGAGVYMFSRADEFHTAPGVVALALALPFCVYAGRRSGRAGTAVAAVAAVVLVLPDRDQRGAQPRLGPAPAPAATSGSTCRWQTASRPAPPTRGRCRGWSGRSTAAPRPARRSTPPGARSDIGGLNNPLLYVLADRPNVLGRDVGLFARPAGQRRKNRGRTLRNARPRAVVRWTDPLSGAARAQPARAAQRRAPRRRVPAARVPRDRPLRRLRRPRAALSGGRALSHLPFVRALCAQCGACLLAGLPPTALGRGGTGSDLPARNRFPRCRLGVVPRH